MTGTGTARGRRLLFAALYFSEGAPIGYLWWALPTRLRAGGVSREDVSFLVGFLALPWAFKFLWAPLVDRFRSERFPLRAFIASAQILMAATLLPVAFLDLGSDFAIVRALVVAHAFAAATQDAAIDALCIATTPPAERARVVGWMQVGMLLGRSAFGGVALFFAARFGDAAAIVPLVSAILAVLVVLFAAVPRAAGEDAGREARPPILPEIRAAVRRRETWFAVAFALVAGLGFEALGANAGPFLLERGLTQESVGLFLAIPAVAGMAAGALAGGRLAERAGIARSVVFAQLVLGGTVLSVSATGRFGAPVPATLAALAAFYLAVGLFTATSYALLMGATTPRLAATQFSAYMGATNGCEALAAFAAGALIPRTGYAGAFAALAALALLALPLARRAAPGR